MELSEDENDPIFDERDDRNGGDEIGARSDEAEEARSGDESKRRVDPSATKKRIVKNPIPKLNIERIKGPKGIHTLENYFQGFKYHGKGHEKNDLDRVMKRIEHWAHRLFPKYRFDDFIEKIESLGTKKEVHVFVRKYRLGMVDKDEDIVRNDDANEAERDDENFNEETPIDEFDKLIAEQIEKRRQDETEIAKDPPASTRGNILGSAATAKPAELSDEIKARIEANKKLALERKLERARKLAEEEEEEQQRASERESELPDVQKKLQEEKEKALLEETEILEEPEREAEKSRKSGEGNSPEKLKQDGQIHSRTVDEDLPYNTGECSLTVRESMYTARDDVHEDPTKSLPEHDEQSMEISSTVAEESYPPFDDPTDINELYTHFPQQSPQENLPPDAEKSEELLSREQLLMEIDSAMEDIIKNRKL